MLAQATCYKPDTRVSMLEDLEAGKRLELEWLSGYVSRERATRRADTVP
jgi:ketopantoate reductase